MDFAEKPLRSVKLIDLQAFADHLAQKLKESSVNRSLSAVKSLFAFGFQLGYFQFDVGRALKLPGFRDELAERILGETEVLRIISLEPKPIRRVSGGGLPPAEIDRPVFRDFEQQPPEIVAVLDVAKSSQSSSADEVLDGSQRDIFFIGHSRAWAFL